MNLYKGVTMSKKYKIKQDCHLCTAKSLQFHFVLKRQYWWGKLLLEYESNQKPGLYAVWTTMRRIRLAESFNPFDKACLWTLSKQEKNKTRFAPYLTWVLSLAGEPRGDVTMRMPHTNINPSVWVVRHFVSK